jgi:UPF0271 protein
MSAEELARSVHEQLLALARAASTCGAVVGHVKPHGALYNEAARNRQIAHAIAEGAARWSREVTMVGLAGSVMLDEFREAGFRVAAEAFADRRYERDGSLRSRQLEGALIVDPGQGALQAVDLVARGVVMAYDGTPIEVRASTICLHGDTPGALDMACAIVTALREAGVAIKPLSAP